MKRETLDPIELFTRASTGATALARTVTADQRDFATPCTEWNVAALLEHIAGGTAQLLGALGLDAMGRNPAH